MIKSGAALLGSNLSLAVLKFLRNLLLARLLSVEEFGIASTFAVIFALIEMTGYLGLDLLLVQSREGADVRVQASLQTIQVARGVLISVLLFVTAAPLAALMGIPEVVWGFQLMSALPLLQGFVHLDTARAERERRFGPFIKTTLGSELAGVLAIYPLFLVFEDYRVALYTLVVQQLFRVALSHALAERAYRLAFDRAVFLRALRFGWPLLLNAFLLFGIFQGDRIIVANQLGMEALGLFSLAFMLTLMATNILSQTQQRLFLPKLAAVQDHPSEFNRFARIALQLSLVLGLAVALGFALLGPDLVLILFGEKYAGVLALLIWLAIMQAVRVAKAGAAVLALARGETQNMALANAFRVAFLPVAWFALEHGADLIVVVWLATLGEMLGLAAALYLLRRWVGVPLTDHGRALTLWAGALILICLDVALRRPHPEVFANFHWAQAGLVLGCGIAVFGMRELRSWVLSRLFRGWSSRPSA